VIARGCDNKRRRRKKNSNLVKSTKKKKKIKMGKRKTAFYNHLQQINNNKSKAERCGSIRRDNIHE